MNCEIRTETISPVLNGEDSREIETTHARTKHRKIANVMDANAEAEHRMEAAAISHGITKRTDPKINIRRATEKPKHNRNKGKMIKLQSSKELVRTTDTRRKEKTVENRVCTNREATSRYEDTNPNEKYDLTTIEKRNKNKTVRTPSMKLKKR